MTKALIFDVGGVLIDNPWPGMVKHYTKHLGVKEAHFLAAYEKLVEKWHTGKWSETEFWQKMAEALDIKFPVTESLWLAGFKKAYKEKNDVFKLIEKLKKRGFKIAILSNTELPVMNFLMEKKYKHFDVFVYSCAEGLAKPNKRIYTETLNRLDVDPSEAIFIDDKPENVQGAEVASITGIVFENPEQLEEVLESLLQ